MDQPKTGVGEKIFFLVYVSSAVRLFSGAQLRGLLVLSRRNNVAAGITGMLLYRQGNFIQVLEGGEAEVRDRFARICRDPRHRGVFVIDEGFADARCFPDWSMGFHDFDRSIEPIDMPGFSRFLTVAWSKHENVPDPNGLRELLLEFKKNVR